jgi:predicted RNA-binding Zn-ribbon protein involved in translation (DUF1610 family)
MKPPIPQTSSEPIPLARKLWTVATDEQGYQKLVCDGEDVTDEIAHPVEGGTDLRPIADAHNESLAKHEEDKKRLGEKDAVSETTVNGQTTLLPCPFCGNTRINIEENNRRGTVYCVQCGGQMHAAVPDKPYGSKIREAANRWNTRVPQPNAVSFS